MKNGLFWIVGILSALFICLLYGESLVIKVVSEDGRILYSSTFDGEYDSISPGDLPIPMSFRSERNRVLIFSSDDTVHSLAEYSAAPDDGHSTYADQAGWAHIAETAFRTLGTSWADSADSANWANEAGHALVSDSSGVSAFAWFSDSTRTSAYADSARVAATSDSSRIASTVSDVPPGDADYIQNQNTAAQTANFWISGAGRIDDSLLVDGNANITGKLTVAGGIDPTYLALTPQTGPPGVSNALWVDALDSSLVYNDGTADIHIITIDDTIPTADYADSARFADSTRIANFSDSTRISAFADSSRISVFADSSRISAFADSSRISSYADTTRISAFADSSRISEYADSAVYCDTCVYSLHSDSAVYADTAFYIAITHIDSSTFADTSIFSWYSSTAGTSFVAHLSDSAVQSIYSDTAAYVVWSDSAVWSDASGFSVYAEWADSSIWADTAGYVVWSDSSVWADTAGYIVWSDSAFWADTSDFSWFADTAGTAFVANNCDSARIASTVSDVPPGDTDYIQNQNTAAQTADFWISGAGRIDDSLLVDGNVNITGKLTVAGAIDPTYLVLTPQAASPGVNNALWIDNTTGELFYNDGTGDAVVVTQNDTAVFSDTASYADTSAYADSSLFADSSAYADSALYADTAGYAASVVIAAHTDGNGLTGGAYDGSAAITWDVDVAANGALTNTGGTGTQLAIQTDGATIGVNGSNQLYVPDGGITENQLNASVAGTGLTGGAGSPLAVIYGIVANTAVEGNQTATINAGNGLTGDMVADALGDGFSATLDVGAGNGISVSADAISVNAGNGLTFSGNQLVVNFGGTGSATTVARSDHTHSTLSNGNGISAFSYDGSAATTVSIDNTWFSGDVTVSGAGAVTVADDSHNHTAATLPAATSYLGASIESAEIADGTITGADIDNTTDISANSFSATTRVTAGTALNVTIYSGANATPVGLPFTAQNGDMIIWQDTVTPQDKICVFIGGVWKCTNVN